MRIFRIIGLDVAKDVRIKSFIAVDPNCDELSFVLPETEEQESQEVAEELWSKQYTSPRYEVEEVTEASMFELDLVVVESNDPKQRRRLADLCDGATHGLIIYSTDI